MFYSAHFYFLATLLLSSEQLCNYVITLVEITLDIYNRMCSVENWTNLS